MELMSARVHTFFYANDGKVLISCVPEFILLYANDGKVWNSPAEPDPFLSDFLFAPLLLPL